MPLFANLDEQALNMLATEASAFDLPGGATLFEQGETGDAIFVVHYGRLRVLHEASGQQRILADVGRGETVGELALLSDRDTRSATVVALRDSELIRIPDEAFLKLLDDHPHAALQLARTVVKRMQSTLQRRHASTAPTRTIGIVSVGGPQTALIHQLRDAIQTHGQTRLVTAASVQTFISERFGGLEPTAIEREAELNRWLNRLEDDVDFVLYVADADQLDWSRRCLRQSDCVLFLVDPAHDCEQTETLLRRCHVDARHQRTEIAFVSAPSALAASRVNDWCQQVAANRHHWLADGSDRDVARLARFLSGNANGLVLAGGGARGFAHIGALRAFAEQGIAIDAIGGSSMGGFIAALYASGMDEKQMRDACHGLFVERNHLNDYCLPRVSLIRGRKFRRQLEHLFGRQCIETLPIPFFCVSTNLSHGRVHVHDGGPLAESVGTSMSIPGVVPPQIYKGDLLVDGGVLNNLPTDVMRERIHGNVLALDVSAFTGLTIEGTEDLEYQALSPVHRHSGGPGLTYILLRTATIETDEQRARFADHADWYLQLPVTDKSMFEWERLDELIDIGYQAARRELEKNPDGMTT